MIPSFSLSFWFNEKPYVADISTRIVDNKPAYTVTLPDNLLRKVADQPRTFEVDTSYLKEKPFCPFKATTVRDAVAVFLHAKEITDSN